LVGLIYPLIYPNPIGGGLVRGMRLAHRTARRHPRPSPYLGA